MEQKGNHLRYILSGFLAQNQYVQSRKIPTFIALFNSIHNCYISRITIRNTVRELPIGLNASYIYGENDLIRKIIKTNFSIRFHILLYNIYFSLCPLLRKINEIDICFQCDFDSIKMAIPMSEYMPQ